MKNYDWLSKKTPRSVDELRLWENNPRLNPEDKHTYISDYVEDFISDSGDKDSFCKLIRSIATHGFIQADPIVFWQRADNNKKLFKFPMETILHLFHSSFSSLKSVK